MTRSFVSRAVVSTVVVSTVVVSTVGALLWGYAAVGAAWAAQSSATVPLTLNGVSGDGAIAVSDTFALPDPVSAAVGTASFQFVLPSPYTSVANAYMKVINNTPNPGTGIYTTAWLLTTSETDPTSHLWTAAGRSDIPAGTYPALVHAISPMLLARTQPATGTSR